jgi:hypothetical protein
MGQNNLIRKQVQRFGQLLLCALIAAAFLAVSLSCSRERASDGALRTEASIVVENGVASVEDGSLGDLLPEYPEYGLFTYRNVWEEEFLGEEDYALNHYPEWGLVFAAEHDFDQDGRTEYALAGFSENREETFVLVVSRDNSHLVRRDLFRFRHKRLVLIPKPCEEEYRADCGQNRILVVGLPQSEPDGFIYYDSREKQFKLRVYPPPSA